MLGWIAIAIGGRRRLVALLALVLAGCGIDTIPNLEAEAKAAWSQVLDQYQRRADLASYLAKAVREAAPGEDDRVADVVQAHEQVKAFAAPASLLTDEAAFRAFEERQIALGSGLDRLLDAVDRHPQLRESLEIIALRSQLLGTERRIAIARGDFIAAVRRYNTELRGFPGRIWASTLYSENEPMPTFTISESGTFVPASRF